MRLLSGKGVAERFDTMVGDEMDAPVAGGQREGQGFGWKEMAAGAAGGEKNETPHILLRQAAPG